MSKRLGRSKLIFGAIALAFALGLIVSAVLLTGYKQQHADERQQATANDTPHASQQIEASCTSVRVARRSETLSCVAQIPNTSDSDPYAEHDLRAQQDMAEWGLAMFIATLFGLGISGVGLWYVREALLLNRDATEHAAKAANEAKTGNELARAQFLAERRPWLSCAVENGRASTTGNRIVLSIDFVITNHGQTPATAVEVQLNKIGPFDEEHRTVFEHMTVIERQRKQTPGDVVFPSESTPLRLNREYEWPQDGRSQMTGWIKYRFEGATRYHLTPFRLVVGMRIRTFDDGTRVDACDVVQDTAGIAPD